ncbi:recombinase family protein [Lacrimispora sp. AGF001]|uniref:recombinase family protein n=1 Tax=Lacrimispora sp. AGF001 TaxID=3401631 RepID=UPI003B4355C4
MGLSDDIKKYKAAIYIRVSKDDGDKMESNSISNQRTLIRSYLENKPDIEICSERVDDGYSGVSFDRPAVKAMLSDIRNGSVNCVIVKDLSRFGRNYIETGRYIEQLFPFMGVRFIAINDGFDSACKQSQADDMIIPFKNLINDAYSRDISVKVRSGQNIRRLRGDYIGAFPLYGYFRSEENKYKLEIDHYAAMTIRDIFRWKIQGMSNQGIAKRLNTMGILSPLEYKRMLGWAYSTSFQLQPVAKWSAASVMRILKNEIYTGTMIQGKESSPNYKVKKRFKKPQTEWIKVVDTHEAIISKDDFFLVKRLLAADTRTSPDNDDLHLFSGLLKCAGCNHGMVRRPVKSGGKTYVYYMCRTQKENKNKCSGKCRIDEIRLTACVLKILQKQIQTSCEMNEIMDYINSLPLKQVDVKKADLRIEKKQEEYSRCQKLMIELYEDYKKGIVNRENYVAWKSNYEENCHQIEEAVQILNQERWDLINNYELQNRWIEEFKKNQNIHELSRPILASLIEKIDVIDRNTMKVYFTFQPGYESGFSENMGESLTGGDFTGKTK